MIIPGAGGYLVEEDYVVMKLSSFQVDFNNATQLWIETVNGAKENGIKNLIVDISGNGGGSVAVGFRLLFLMFPEAGLEWFTNQWEINWNNPMTQYIEAFAPLLDIVVEQLIDVPDEVSLYCLVFEFLLSSPEYAHANVFVLQNRYLLSTLQVLQKQCSKYTKWQLTEC